MDKSASVRIFHREIPVIGDAAEIECSDGIYKFWALIGPDDESLMVLREMVGKVTLQQRIDDFLRHEAGVVLYGQLPLYATHIEPATVDDAAVWLGGHRKVHVG